ncbi:MAG TPA: Fe-S-binding domain-containing protein, partial [Anaerolineae bacterium]|nr:Fe-S-binding domain-containing protein [Anaerolineae bacterium]
GIVFTAAYILWKVVQHLFLGSLDTTRWAQLPDLTWWEQLTVAPLVVLTVVLGLYPAPLLATFDAAVQALLRTLF